MIYLGADHAGYESKEIIKKWLIERGESITDLGTETTENVDFPEYAQKVSEAVVEHRGKGILFCHSGQGMAIVANKIAGIRAVIAWDPEIAKETRERNDANILVLPSGYINDNVAKDIIQCWLSTPFSGKDRYLNRLKQIADLEK